MDIPHHEAKIRKKRPKDKFPMSKLRWKNMNSILKVQQVKDNRKKKKRKKPNVVSNHDFDKYSSLTLGKTTAIEIGRNIEDSKGNCSKELKNPETAQCLCEDKQKHIHYHEIPLCLWYRQKMTVMEIDSKQNSLFNLKEKIRTEFGIPAKLQLLMYKGKDMQRTASSINFQPYDNIFVSIKGRGGMQEPLTGVTTGSSERDVEQWLKKEVGINDVVLEKFSILTDLDGQTLFSYDIGDIESFILDTELPVGLARKILGFRDKINEGISNPLMNYTAEEISGFIKRILTVNDQTISHLCQCIVDRHIDGYVFFSYIDEKQFQYDFRDLNIKGMYFKKIILKRNEEFSIPHGGQKATQLKTTCSEELTEEENLLLKPVQEENCTAEEVSEAMDYPVPDAFADDSTKSDYERTLCCLLRLNKVQESNCKPCKLGILHGGWTNVNELEKNFVFFLLSCEDEFTEKQQQSGLWKQIGKNMDQWLNLLPPSKRDMFTESRQSGVYNYNKKKKVQLPAQCKLAFVMDKELSAILKFETAILLVSRSLLQKQCGGFMTPLSKHPKKPSSFPFSFHSSEEYYIFNPEDYSDGFIKETVPTTCSEQRSSVSNSKLVHLSSEEFPVNIGNTVEKVPETRMPDDRMKDFDHSGHRIVESNPNLYQRENENPILYQRKNEDPILNQRRNEENQQSSSKTVAKKHVKKSLGTGQEVCIQIPRDFKKNSEYVVYHAGKIFHQPENDGTLSTRCIEFKAFFSCVNKTKEARLIKFQMEVLRFACGCLNARKNGTIYFGVADSVQNIDDEEYKHGEIVGFEISEIGYDTRSKYTDALLDGISRCFMSENVAIVKKCVSNPIFVKVVITGEQICRYVMEVDVEPSSYRCREYHFKVNLKNIKNLSNKSIENKHLLYLRSGSSTERLINEREQLFIKAELLENVKERKLFENQQKNENLPKMEPLASKLERLLTRGTYSFDKRLWPILVLGKPMDEQKMNEKWTESISFIKRIQFTAVFDFDEMSDKNGLCNMYRNPERSTLQTERLFNENAGNLQELANKLGLPYDVKTVWIFANGRSDYFEEKPHLSRSGWHVSYSAGVCDAVSFFNQNFVIPKGRAVILVLLFSNDYDGLIDTFNEITRNFGWGPLVIIAEHQRIFDDFTDIIQQESKGDKEQLEKVSIIGMPWEHINSTITSLTGYDEKMNCMLPCSSGALVHVNERLLDSLDNLSILSANQCENKKFKNIKDRKQFAREQELQFYKGKHVTWWNFYFENHVCERHKFHHLQERAQDLLLHAKEETRKIVTFTIAHEPGVGATTLGHKLLWHFRRKYRCCVIQKISETTISHIYSLWQYMENNTDESLPQPVVLLLDDIQTELSLTDFTRLLNLEFRKRGLNKGMGCLLMICQREEKLTDYDYESQNVFFLRQELSHKEKTWFAEKFDELEQTGRELDDYNPKHLISFMIMRSEFNPEYIKNTIEHLISTIDHSSNEYKLMKYVSFLATYAPLTRRGVKVFVPLECCDELMGSKVCFWEDRLSSPLRILLIIEEKEQSSGRQVRIAHPSLGKILIIEIMKREKAQLADIAKEFLNCSLLQSTSYGRNFLVDFTLEMLKRRKKEEYDDEKTTLFSPLILEIISESEDNFGKAAEILQLGFNKFKDFMLAQALARLYSKWKRYDEAILWAKEAVDLSSKHSLSYILHTYGLVLREKFRHLTNSKFFQPKDAIENLKLILESLEVFLHAQRKRDDETDTQKLLYPFHDAIYTINEITRFLVENIKCSMDESDIVQYLKDKDFIPEEISNVWRNFHQRLKGMKEQGHNAFKVLEDNICFNTTFYAPEEAFRYNSNKLKEHRFYRSFHYGHERMLENFTKIYGEHEIDYQLESADQRSRDEFHRGRLWTLKGNSYMNIFNHIKNCGNKHLARQITGKLITIKKHIMTIEAKDSNDLANEICVNVALGIMGGQHHDSESDILKTCQKIISASNEKVDLAYFFISMLLWPSGERKVFYDDSLLQRSLSYLKRNFKQQKYKSNVQKSSHVKEESNISQPTPQFFLAKGKGIQSLCHRWEIFVRENPDSQFDNSLWGHIKTKEKLRRLCGTTTTSSDGSSTYIVFKNKHGEPIRISKIRGTNKGYESEEEVSFYLGFSIAGPIAYNVKLMRYEQQSHGAFSQRELLLTTNSKVEEFMKSSKEDLQNMLLKIRGLEGKRPDYLKEREKQLIKDKDGIKEALYRLEMMSGEMDLSLID
ncbi:sterile alpha motif domain-containing protein 9-like isoform X2 [Ostrea edulis]|uniref:sterile alpha motif domain-containing protein 9-like isoform X2 n=1 Tax=Ostrea edulis TaxID=37623 RepID=UPI0024AF4EEC|nr:sterile alpha motif domain-containing protein 9-like isoform X2 [Ostrea edulis]